MADSSGQHVASWIRAVWPVALALILACGAVMLVQQQASANAEAVKVLEAKKADKELVSLELNHIKQSLNEIKAALGVGRPPQ